MEHGEHNLEGGDFELGVLVDGDAATVVFDRAGAVFVDGHVDLVAKPAESLVDGVVDDLPDEVMKAARAGRADVHARALADGLEALEHLDVFSGIGGFGLCQFNSLQHGKRATACGTLPS